MAGQLDPAGAIPGSVEPGLADQEADQSITVHCREAKGRIGGPQRIQAGACLRRIAPSLGQGLQGGAQARMAIGQQAGGAVGMGVGEWNDVEA